MPNFIIEASHIKKEYYDKTILNFPKFTLSFGNRIGLVGKNGAGKTTLLDILMGNIKPDERIIKRSIQPFYLKQLEENPSVELSGGERIKQAIAQLPMAKQVLFADEPTANLDEKGVQWVKHQLSLTHAFILVSHDRYLLDSMCNKIVELEEDILTFYTGNYSDYEETKETILQKKKIQNAVIKKKEKQIKKAIDKKQNQVARTNQ